MYVDSVYFNGQHLEANDDDDDDEMMILSSAAMALMCTTEGTKVARW